MEESNVIRMKGCIANTVEEWVLTDVLCLKSFRVVRALITRPFDPMNHGEVLYLYIIVFKRNKIFIKRLRQELLFYLSHERDAVEY